MVELRSVCSLLREPRHLFARLRQLPLLMVYGPQRLSLSPPLRLAASALHFVMSVAALQGLCRLLQVGGACVWNRNLARRRLSGARAPSSESACRYICAGIVAAWRRMGLCPCGSMGVRRRVCVLCKRDLPCAGETPPPKPGSRAPLSSQRCAASSAGWSPKQRRRGIHMCREDGAHSKQCYCFVSCSVNPYNQPAEGWHRRVVH